MENCKAANQITMYMLGSRGTMIKPTHWFVAFMNMYIHLLKMCDSNSKVVQQYTFHCFGFGWHYKTLTIWVIPIGNILAKMRNVIRVGGRKGMVWVAFPIRWYSSPTFLWLYSWKDDFLGPFVCITSQLEQSALQSLLARMWLHEFANPLPCSHKSSRWNTFH